MAFVAKFPHQHIGKQFLHDEKSGYRDYGAQCAALVQQLVPAVGGTKTWRPGQKVWSENMAAMTPAPPSSLGTTSAGCYPTSNIASQRQSSFSSGLESVVILENSSVTPPYISLGTVVATFDENNRYPDSNQHTGLFVRFIPDGFEMIDQYVKRPNAQISQVTSKSGGYFDPRRYFVVVHY